MLPGKFVNGRRGIAERGQAARIVDGKSLPPEEAGKLLNWARQLADLAGGRTVEWSDSWTDEDLADATAAAIERFEDQEREGR